MDLPHWKQTLETAGVLFAPGLTAEELRRAEAVCGSSFPEDLAELLSFALPVGDKWPDWRNPESPEIAAALAWPLEGILFDIEDNEFWLEEWGPRPASREAAFSVARDKIAEAPPLIPLYGHRYLPARPLERGNPVLSVYQTDIIYYGRDLEEYFRNEFLREPGAELRVAEPARRIELWSALTEGD